MNSRQFQKELRKQEVVNQTLDLFITKSFKATQNLI